MQISKIRKMAECAMMIALGTILSYLIIFSLPMGGTITAFSQVPLILIGYRHGWKWGAFSGVVFGLLQMVLQGLGNFAYVKTLGAYLILIFFDYVLAFGVLGLSGAFFRRLKNQPLGIGLGVQSGLQWLLYAGGRHRHRGGCGGAGFGAELQGPQFKESPAVIRVPAFENAGIFIFPARNPIPNLAKPKRVLYNETSCCRHGKDETMNNKVKVTIAGKNYVLNTDETERYTRMLAGKLDKDLAQVMQSDETIGLTDSVILTALDYLDQYKKASDDADNLRGQLTTYIDDSNKLSSKLEAAQKELKKQQQLTQQEVAKAVEAKDAQIKELNELLESARQKAKELENQIGFMSLKEKLENGKK